MALMALMGVRALLCMCLAACSATTPGSGGINLSSGLAGSTIDHPGKPPTIAANGPTGAYAFVYDNQIWLRQNGENQAEQLTHMAISKGSIITWGPLVWSPDGRYIAFTVVENLDLASGGSSSYIGLLYYLDTATIPPRSTPVQGLAVSLGVAIRGSVTRYCSTRMALASKCSPQAASTRVRGR